MQTESAKWRPGENRDTALATVDQHARGTRPRGLLSRMLHTALMIASPKPASKWKNLALWAKAMLNSDCRRLWGLSFDEEYYRATYRDVDSLSAALHYIVYGHLEGRSPSPHFNARAYTGLHEDVQAEGINPLLHYILFGAKEQRLVPPPGISGDGLTPFTVSETLVLRRFTPSCRPSDLLVSVVIPCFNYGDCLGEALASVTAQTFTNWEIVVVEGGSTDASSVEAVRAIEATGLPNTTFLYRDSRHLAGDNRNYGIQHSRGEYICCLDADDLIKPTYLEAAVFLAETYGYDLVYPSVQCFGEATHTWPLRDPTFEQLLDHNEVSTVALFRRSAWERVGGYRDWGLESDHVPEDWHLWVRMLAEGCRPKAIAEPLMLYRVNQNSLWHSTRHHTNKQRAKIRADCKSVRPRPKTRPAAGSGDWQRLLREDDAVNGAVLLALPFLTIGGAERIFEAITSTLLSKGRRVIIVTSLVPNAAVKDNRRHFEKLTPHLYSLPHLLEGQEYRWPDFVSYLLSRYRVETIFTAGSAFLYSCLPAIRRAFPEVAVVDQLFNDQVHFAANRTYAQYIDKTVVPSDAFARRIVTEHGEDAERVAVIPHGVCVPPAPTPAEMADARETAGLPPDFRDCLLVAFFGRMSAEKAPLDFVEIAHALAPDTRIAFVMTGEGPEHPAVLRRIDNYGLRSRIHTPGFVEDVSDLLAAVDIVVVPSHLDGMPLLILEALGLEKAVVASRVGSIPSMVRDRETGLLCNPGDIGAFISAVRELQESPEWRLRLGAAGRKLVLEHYSSEVMVNHYLAVFEQAASAARARLESPTAHSGEPVSPDGA